MILILVVAVGLGWATHRLRARRAAVAALDAAGIEIVAVVDEVGPRAPWPARALRAVEHWLVPWVGAEAFVRVQRLTISRPVTSAILPLLAQFEDLEGLTCDQVPANSDGWDQLGQLKRLRTLSLTGQGVDDALLAAVSRVRTLEELDLTGTSAADLGIAALADLPALTDPDLVMCPNLTDAGLARMLAGLPCLRLLWLRKVVPGRLAATIEALERGHRDLTSLNLAGASVTDADLARIGTMTGVRDLHLERSEMTDAGLVHLRRLPNLTGLNLGSTRVTDAGVEILGKMTRLTRLILFETRLTDTCLPGLARLPLENLNLSGTDGTDDGMPALGQITTLNVLSLRMLPGLTDNGLGALRSLIRLRGLALQKTAVTAEGAAALQQDLPRLRVWR